MEIIRFRVKKIVQNNDELFRQEYKIRYLLKIEERMEDGFVSRQNI